MTELFAAMSLVGFAASTGLAIWIAVVKGDYADARIALRDARTEVARADARAQAAEAIKAADAATIVRLKQQIARAAKERNDEAERKALAGADGGGDAALRSIRELYPDADSDD